MKIGNLPFSLPPRSRAIDFSDLNRILQEITLEARRQLAERRLSVARAVLSLLA